MGHLPLYYQVPPSTLHFCSSLFEGWKMVPRVCSDFRFPALLTLASFPFSALVILLLLLPLLGVYSLTTDV